MTSACRIVIVGGGVWITRLVPLLARLEISERLEIVLTARHIKRLQTISDYCATLVADRPSIQVRCAPLKAALRNAQICVLMLRVGGSAARDIDERFPEKFGLAGDEGLGLGGFANALRTLPVMRSIAASIRSIAPECAVINLVAPLGVTTRALIEMGVPAAGLCELPLTTEERLLDLPPDATGDRDLRYAGLNHLGWFAAEPPHDGAFLEAAVAGGFVSEATARRYEAVPLSYFAKMCAHDAQGRAAAGPSRAQRLEQLAHEALSRIQARQSPDDVIEVRDMPWLDRTLAPVIAALVNNTRWRGFANLPAADNVAWCPQGTVVEARASLDSGRWTLMPQVPMNEAVTGFLQASAVAEDHIYRASLGRDPHAEVLKAIAVSPLTIPLQALDSAARAILEASRAIKA